MKNIDNVRSRICLISLFGIRLIRILTTHIFCQIWFFCTNRKTLVRYGSGSVLNHISERINFAGSGFYCTYMKILVMYGSGSVYLQRQLMCNVGRFVLYTYIRPWQEFFRIPNIFYRKKMKVVTY